MLPAELELSIYAGDTFTIAFVFSRDGAPIDPTDAGLDFDAQVRPNLYAEDAVSFAISILDDTMVQLTLGPEDTRTVGAWGDARWDLQVTENDHVSTWLRGDVRGYMDVTRP